MACVCRFFCASHVSRSYFKGEKMFFWAAELKVFCPTDFCHIFSELFVPGKLPWAPFLLHSHQKRGSNCTNFSMSKAMCMPSSQARYVGQPAGSSKAVSQGCVMTTFPMEWPAISTSVLNPDSDLYKTLRNLIMSESFIPNFNLNQPVGWKVIRRLFIDWNTDQCDHKSFLFLGN